MLRNFYIITIMSLLLLGHFPLGEAQTALSPEQRQEVQQMIQDMIHNETEKDVNSYLKGLSLKDAFKKTTGYSLETVLIIIVLVMMIPTLVMNIVFCVCTTAVKSGAEVSCCCCKNGVKGLCSCCQKLLPCVG